MKKTLLALAPLFLFSHNESLEKQVSILEEKVERLQQHREMTTESVNNEYFFTFELLYWHPKTDYTEIGSTQTRNASTPALANGSSTPYIDFNWEFGFSFGLGYHYAERNWDVTAKYTRVQCNDSFSFNPGSLKQIQSNFGAAGSGNPFPLASMKGSHRIDYQTLKAELSRRFFLTGYIDITPSFGAKATWINQLPHIVNQTSGGTPPDIAQHVYISEKTTGLGPITMFYSNWKLCDGWSIYADSGFALLFTRYRGNMSVEGGTDGNTKYPNYRQSNKERKHYVTPNMMLELGVRYIKSFGSGCNNLACSFGYESQYYINQSYLMQNRDINSQEVQQGAWFGRNLSMYGFTGNLTYAY